MHFRLLLIMEANTMNPDQTAALILVQIVCNINYQEHTQIRLQTKIVVNGGKRVKMSSGS